MTGPLVTDELVEVHDFRKITDFFRGIYGIHFEFIKEIRKITTCNWLDLETRLGF